LQLTTATGKVRCVEWCHAEAGMQLHRNTSRSHHHTSQLAAEPLLQSWKLGGLCCALGCTIYHSCATHLLPLAICKLTSYMAYVCRRWQLPEVACITWSMLLSEPHHE
jgi:hypothetical protein